MSVVEDVRQVLQDFLAPELREIRARLDTLDRRLDSQDKRIDTIESANGARYRQSFSGWSISSSLLPLTDEFPTLKLIKRDPLSFVEFDGPDHWRLAIRLNIFQSKARSVSDASTP